jgi:hypothetical protein
VQLNTNNLKIWLHWYVLKLKLTELKDITKEFCTELIKPTFLPYRFLVIHIHIHIFVSFYICKELTT